MLRRRYGAVVVGLDAGTVLAVGSHPKRQFAIGHLEDSALCDMSEIVQSVVVCSSLRLEGEKGVLSKFAFHFTWYETPSSI